MGAKKEKSYFEIILVPALAAFFMGLVPIALLVIGNWVGANKDERGKKPALVEERPPRPAATEPAPRSPATERAPEPAPAFQPRSSPKDVLTVGHGKVEVTAQAIRENRVVLTLVGRHFGEDLSPLNEWLGKTGDLFKRKLEQVGAGSGSWELVSEARNFTVRDGVASLELTFQRK